VRITAFCFVVVVCAGCATEDPAVLSLRKWIENEVVSDWSVVNEYVQEPAARSQEVPRQHRGEAIALLENTTYRRLSADQVAHLGGRQDGHPAYVLRALAFADRPYVIDLYGRANIVGTHALAKVPGDDPKLLRTAVFYYDSRPIEHCYVDFELPRPNHAMQPTTGPRTASLFMTKPRSFQITLAAASGG
jgi:hypothetical protein